MGLPAGRRWCVADADASLPSLTDMIESVRHAVARAGTRPETGVAAGADLRLLIRGVLDLLAVDGIVLRDLERGLVDFPARSAAGRDYWLCWVVGEPAVTWWHWPEDGFGGRQPLRALPD